MKFRAFLLLAWVLGFLTSVVSSTDSTSSSLNGVESLVSGQGTVLSPETPGLDSVTKPEGETRNGVRDGGVLTNTAVAQGWIQSAQDWLVACILVATLMVSWFAYVWQTRPVIKMTLVEEENWQLIPVLTSITNTDALGIVIFRLRIGDSQQTYAYEEDAGAYTGSWLWSFPAEALINGRTSLDKTVARLRKTPGVLPDASIYLEVYVYYVRWKTRDWNLLKRFVPKLRIVYAAPPNEWELRQEPPCVFVPAHRRLKASPRIGRSILREATDRMKPADWSSQ